MKKYAFMVVILLVSCGLLFAGCGKKAENDAPPVGGYGEARDVEEDDKLVFDAALSEEQRAMYMPISVSTQVVAGTNYNFYCAIVENGVETGKHANIIIYKPLGEDEAPTVSEIQEAS